MITIALFPSLRDAFMGSARVFGRFVFAVGLVGFLACGGDTPGITDPPDDGPDGPDVPVDTAVVNAGKRAAKANEYLTQLNDALTAMGQAGGAGGAGGPQGSNAVFAEAAVLAGGPATLAAAPPPANSAACTFDEANVRWNCPDFTQTNGLVSSSWFQFLDAAGAPHKFVDTTKTASIKRVVTLSGVIPQTIPVPGQGPTPMNDTTLQSDTLTLSGLLGPAADRKAISTGHIKHVMVAVSNSSTIVRMSGPKTVEDFKFAAPVNGQPPAARYPISGKITLLWTTSQDGVANSTATTTQVTTYNGTAIATLVIRNALGNVIRTCTYDMTNPNTPPSCTP